MATLDDTDWLVLILKRSCSKPLWANSQESLQYRSTLLHTATNYSNDYNVCKRDNLHNELIPLINYATY